MLISDVFDSVERSGAREMAAWSARRLGGDRMVQALIDSAERRDGRDPYTLFYLAVLSGEEALPVIERHRVPRMRYLKWTRMFELEYLDWITRQIRSGRSIERLDVAPEGILIRTPPQD